MNNKLVTAVLAAAIIALGGYTFTHQSNPSPDSPRVGALSSPDISSPYLSFGGVRQWAATESFVQATTSLCAIQAPAATTTLEAATARIDFSTTSVAVIEIGNATNAFATTTLLARFNMGASATNLNLVATTTATALVDRIVPPNSWINVKMGTTNLGGAAGNIPTGRCNVVFREI